MASSTSHSDRRVPWLAVRLLAVALLAWGAAAAYSVWLNPEVRFFHAAHEAKQAWLAGLAQSGGPKTLVCGGSGTGTSVDSARMLREHGLRVANLGLGAGMGAKIITDYALRELQPGDTLVIAIEPDLLLGVVANEPLGVQFSFAIGATELLRASRRVDWLPTLLDLRPGAYHVCTLAGKTLLRKPLYRYQAAELQPGGWQQVADRRLVRVDVPAPKLLSDDGRKLLERVRDECARQGVRVAYSFPFTLVEPSQLEAHRRFSGDLARQFAGCIPVLRDPDFGANTNRALFADTSYHPTHDGAGLRTDALARQIRSWELWRADELTVPRE